VSRVFEDAYSMSRNLMDYSSKIVVNNIVVFKYSTEHKAIPTMDDEHTRKQQVWVGCFEIDLYFMIKFYLLKVNSS
jgi:hypothetical protein